MVKHSRRRGGAASVDTRGGREGLARVDDEIGARTTRSAALDQQGDSLAVRRSLDVAGAGSDRAEPAMRRGEQGARDATRRTVECTARRARASTKGSIRVRQGWRRSIGTTTRSRLGACSASPAPALTEPSWRCDEENRRRGDVTRHTAETHGTARARVDERSGARTTRPAALGRHDDSLAAPRSLGVASAGSDRAEPAMRRGGRA